MPSAAVTRSKTGPAAASPTTAPAPRALVLLPLLSTLGGFAVHIFAVHLAPRNQLKLWFQKTVAELAAEIKMSNAWPAVLRGVGASTDANARGAVKTLLVLLAFFRDMLSTQLARGFLWLLAVASMPLLLHILLESVKTGRAAILTPLNIIIVSSIGQVFCLGGATNIISVPSHAYARYLQIKQANDALNASKKDDDAGTAVTLEQVVHPIPSASFFKVQAAALFSGLAMLTIALSIHLDPKRLPQEWIAANVAFQFFPIFFLPLLLPLFGAPAAKKITPAPPAGTAVVPRLDAARMYQLVSLLTVPLWWFGLYLAAAPLSTKITKCLSVIRSIGGYIKAIHFIRTAGIRVAINVAFPLSHGEWLLIWDLVGILIALVSVVWIDQAADQWAYDLFANRVPGYRRPHEKRFLLEDLIVGLPSALLLGPGFAGARYFQRREILAEKVRLLHE
ncbi:hypothetical protein OC835_000123 [Tilletia horrida]|nr:hypothetical protein OC835_000123 [Tilletia horrida]KAK0567846.1 hypothetical protein OC844_000047 [Tilletia horrida]